MDCNILCCTLVALLVAFAATFVHAEKLCADGIKTIGYTEPSGDILLLVGQSLEIFCTLYPSPHYTSSSLTFYRNNEEVQKEYLHIVNETTLRLYIPHPPSNQSKYTCKLNKTDQGSAVCLNNVFFGLKPQAVQNFTCISHNWNDLVCSWIPAKNKIKTVYDLSFSLPRNRKMLYKCPGNTENLSNSCNWNASSEPPYSQTSKDYRFLLTAKNPLGTNSWTYNISFFATVVPDKPNNLTALFTEGHSVLLRWFKPSGLENYPHILMHQVEYRNKYENDWQQVDLSSLFNSSNKYELMLSNLSYFNTYYHIRVRSRSSKAADPHRWSEYADITILTKPTLPAIPPPTDVGSFEVSSTNSHSLREVYLYWQEIPKFMENGNSFKYKIKSVEENGLSKDVTPHEVTRFSACFKNLSSRTYRFKLVSSNIVGDSINYSEINIPAESERPPAPELVTQIPFSSKTYEISWKSTSNQSKILSHTIFWCKNKSYQCSGDLNWINVGGNVTVKNITVDGDEYQVFMFGVSTNSGRVSSGIVWASCTLLPGRGGGQMQSLIPLKIGSTSVHVSWKFDCSSHVGVPLGFVIEFCWKEDNSTLCREVELDGGDKRDYSITDLKPYTDYSFHVKTKQSGGTLGVPSRAIHVTTLEDKPSPITMVKITKVTSTTISLEWSPPENFNGKLIHYIVMGGNAPHKVDPLLNSFTLEGLESSKEYSISVSACTNAGCGQASRVEREVTLIGQPGAPQDLQIRYLNSSNVMATWDPPTSSAGNLTYYFLQFQVWSSDEMKFEKEILITETEAVLPLDKCEEGSSTGMYKVKVKAVNQVEEGNLEGPWTKVQQGPCVLSNAPPHLTVIIPLVGVLLSLVLCIFCALFSQHLWARLNKMRDISVKLPARLGARPEDKSDNHPIHLWNHHIVQEADNNSYRPSPDQQSLLKSKEEIELVQEEVSGKSDNYHSGLVQNGDVSTSGGSEAEGIIITAPAPAAPPGYMIVSPPGSGYVTLPPLATGYMMATLPPSPNSASPSLPQCSMISLKQNNLNSLNTKTFNSLEPPHFSDMISPINTT